MKKALLTLVCGFILILAMSDAPAALSDEAQMMDQWRTDKHELTLLRHEFSRDMYFPSTPVVQGLYIEFSSAAGYPMKTFSRGEEINFIICISTPVDGLGTWEWAVYRNGQIVYDNSFSTSLTVGYWKLAAGLTIPNNAPLGNYEWSARFTDGIGRTNNYPVKLPIVIESP